MYTVTFINSNGQNISIKNVAEIEYGDSCDSMDKIPSEKIMDYIFPIRGIYRLTGPIVNTTYFANENIVCVSVTTN